jgi:hypothetical protein
MARTRLQLAAAAAAIGILTSPVAASAASGPGAPRTPVPGVNSLDSVTCPTAAACVAVGLDSNLNGKSAVINAATGAVKAWSGDLANAPLNAVACAGTTSCVTVADDTVASLKVSTGAMKQTAKPKAPTGGIVALGAVACAGTTKCYAVGFEGPNFESTNAVVITLSPAGKLLADKKNTGTGIGAIACPSSSLCLMSDASPSGVSIQLLKDGKAGTSKPLPANTYVEAISCFKASLCYALGGNSKSSPVATDELFPLNPKTGAIGTMATIGGFSAGTGVNGIRCISATTCLVAGYTGSGSAAKPAMVIVSSGKPGAPVNYKGSDFPFDGVGCASDSRCYAVGSSSTGAVVVKVKS